MKMGGDGGGSSRGTNDVLHGNGFPTSVHTYCTMYDGWQHIIIIIMMLPHSQAVRIISRRFNAAAAFCAPVETSCVTKTYHVTYIRLVAAQRIISLK
jgi:hypothetical protein